MERFQSDARCAFFSNRSFRTKQIFVECAQNTMKFARVPLNATMSIVTVYAVWNMSVEGFIYSLEFHFSAVPKGYALETRFTGQDSGKA